jgi:hypothetical protein
MSIERSNTPASSKLVLAAEGNNKVKEKNRDQAADRADGADAGGFASVLTSLAPPRESKAESQKEPKTQTQTQTPATGAVAVSKVVDFNGRHNNSCCHAVNRASRSFRVSAAEPDHYGSRGQVR